jgi:surface polysaccharide O-acyltransferase-like enzyme
MELTSYSSQFVFENVFVIFSLVILLFIPRYSKIFWNIDSSYNAINTKRLKSIDAIKGMAIIAVILIHTCYLLLYKYNGAFEIVTLNFINNISRFAIPVFLFTSGLLLKPFIWRKEYILNFYTSKFIRIGIPFILINIILWQIGYNASDTLWKLIFTGGMATPFYFIPILFQLYLLYPLLDYIRKINPKYLLRLSLTISIISFFIPATWYLYNFPLSTQYLIFFVYGMLRQDILSEKISNIWKELILIYIIFNVIFIISMLYNNLSTNTFKLLYFYNFQPILGFGFIFLVFKYLQSHKFGSQTTNSIFAPIGRISLWIFLIHFPIQQFLFRNIIDLNLSLSIKLIHNFILTSFTSIILAFIMAKIYDIPKIIILYFTKK